MKKVSERCPLEALRRRVLIKLGKWSEEREQWQRAVQRDLSLAALLSLNNRPWTGPNRLPCHVHCKRSE